MCLLDPSKVFYGFESEDYLPLSFGWESGPLLIGSVLVWHYLGLLNGGIICFVIERSIATLLSKDYETTPRRWLTVFLHILHHFNAIFMCLFFSFHVLPLNILLVFNAIGFAFIVPYIFFLRYYNEKERNKMRLAENITNHSLTAKFQTEENMRSMNIAARISIIVGVFDILFLVVIILATCQVPGAEIFFQATEVVLILNPLFLIPGIISSVAEWRNKFMEHLPITRLRIDPNHNPYIIPEHNHKRTAELPFSQLQACWI
uniref:G protein-coupled receptor n=1 Tax=Caenorhabditis tropicalis TaxID=1561998 RepID=A0A1I7T6M4_9PELO